MEARRILPVLGSALLAVLLITLVLVETQRKAEAVPRCVTEGQGIVCPGPSEISGPLEPTK